MCVFVFGGGGGGGGVKRKMHKMSTRKMWLLLFEEMSG